MKCKQKENSWHLNVLENPPVNIIHVLLIPHSIFHNTIFLNEKHENCAKKIVRKIENL